MSESILTQEYARGIMGKNFLGIEEAIQHLKIEPTIAQLNMLQGLPFSREQLEAFKDSHILVADFGLSILEVRERIPRGLFYSYENEDPRQGSWYNKESFVAEKLDDVSWRLVRKDSAESEKLSARSLIYAMTLLYLATGERMFERSNMLTSSAASKGRLVLVGFFDEFGLAIGYTWSP